MMSRWATGANLPYCSDVVLVFRGYPGRVPFLVGIPHFSDRGSHRGHRQGFVSAPRERTLWLRLPLRLYRVCPQRADHAGNIAAGRVPTPPPDESTLAHVTGPSQDDDPGALNHC
jgi:hypothetical protein